MRVNSDSVLARTRAWFLLLLCLGLGKCIDISLPSFDPDELLKFQRQAICFQQRTIAQHALPEYRKLCGSDMVEHFCDNVQCEPIPVCRDGTKLVPNVVGHGCCAACVKFIENGKPCKSGTKLEQCENGLVCNPSKGRCDVPREQRDCLIEFHNRNLVKNLGKSFYVKEDVGRKYIELKFQQKLQMPICSGTTGDYEIKQQTLNKAYCVRSNDGQPTFGVVDIHRASNLTCKCADSLQQQLIGTGDPNEVSVDQINKNNREHFSDTHIRCKSSGNFAELQCANETCLCVDEKSGVPVTRLDESQNDDADEDSDKKDDQNESKGRDVDLKLWDQVKYPSVVTYGAQSALACFDQERSKLIGNKLAGSNFVQACQKQKFRSSDLERHFALKGTTVQDLDQVVCDFDDRFRRYQCKNGICKCTDPVGGFIGSYGSASTDSVKMECRCALEEYYVDHEKLPFEKLPCDGSGNFAHLYCSATGMCTCSDDNGTPISEPFSMDCAKRFIRDLAPNFNLLEICTAMSTSISSRNVKLDSETMLYYDNNHKTYQITDVTPEPNDLYC